MAPLVLDADQQAEAMKAATSELKFLLGKEGISELAQGRLYHVGATTLAKFSAFFTDEKDLRTVAKDELGIDPANSLKERSELAGLIVAYGQAKTRTEEVAKHLGELDARSQVKPLVGSDFLSMKAAFEQKYAKLEDQETPSRLYLEKRIAEMESGDMRAESLKAVLNREQEGEETFIPAWDSSGGMKLKKSVSEIDEPANPEELRRRLGVMVNGLIFLSLMHTNRHEFRDVKPELSNQYAAYLLGDHVWSFVAKDEQGLTVASPNWALIVQYEFAIRKRAYREMQERGISFPVALRESWLDPLTKERFFTTPLSIASSSGSKKVEISGKRMGEDQHQHQNNKKQKSGGKGQGKGGFNKTGKGGSGRGGSGKHSSQHNSKLEVPKGCARFTPDGKPICFGYNDRNVRCRNPRCTFEHVCGVCFQRHPLYACNGRKKFESGDKPAETQGSGK